jgi:peptidyl-prolyl cis-trans isomerase B (cyclophilin B)
VLQCGDPTGTGSGGPGYQFPDELSGKEKYNRGVLAMANAGPNTNGSQFFIVYKNSQLPPNYTIFGSVTSGLSVVDKVARKGVQGGGGDGKPVLPVTIKKVTLKS